MPENNPSPHVPLLRHFFAPVSDIRLVPFVDDDDGFVSGKNISAGVDWIFQIMNSQSAIHATYDVRGSNTANRFWSDQVRVYETR